MSDKRSTAVWGVVHNGLRQISVSRKQIPAEHELNNQQIFGLIRLAWRCSSLLYIFHRIVANECSIKLMWLTPMIMASKWHSNSILMRCWSLLNWSEILATCLFTIACFEHATISSCAHVRNAYIRLLRDNCSITGIVEATLVIVCALLSLSERPRVLMSSKDRGWGCFVKSYLQMVFTFHFYGDETRRFKNGNSCNAKWYSDWIHVN